MDLRVFDGIDANLVGRFLEYHRKNPRVYQDFCILARSMKAAGRKRYSAWIIVNKIRWEYDLKTNGDSFKINNDFIALYARMAMEEFPQLEGFFATRATKPERRQLSDEQRRRERV